ncbi:MAG: polysaccharide biosynthesis C-terminal domain-containing protein, partial [Pseudomonadota bacterium]
TRRPFHFAVVSMVVNAALAIGLSPVIGYLAAAIGTTVSAYAMLALLWWGARRHEGAIALDSRLKSRLPRLALAAIIMGAACLATDALLGDALTAQTLRYGALFVLVGVGIISYGLAAYALGGLRPADLKAALRKSPEASG